MDAIREALQPVTHNLPTPVRDLGKTLLGDVCYKRLVLDIDLSDQDCLKLAVSKALGSAIVTVSAIVKLPQLFNLINSQSAAGVSFLAYALETAAFLITLAYNVRMNNPFSTYGENAFIAVQNIVISCLVLHYGGKSAGAAVFVAGLAGAVYTLFSGNLVDMKTMGLLQAGAGIIAIASKLPQIFTIWQEGTTGQLSAFAVFNYLFGSLSRIFTTIQEVNDPVILYGYIAGFTLNLVIAFQMIYYWRTPAKKATPTIRVESEKGEPIPIADAATASAVPIKSKSPTTRRRG